jgi:3-hydroxyethyl bacteriochlorophyllide a dehydrogenase
MFTPAVILDGPGRVDLRPIELRDVGSGDVVVDVAWSGISSGTERLLWSGRMPDFPGMGYPLVPGYETVGRVVATGDGARHWTGSTVFVPGANAFPAVRSLFGGAAARLVVPSSRIVQVDDTLGERATLFALAATAHHIAPLGSDQMPELIVGHGVVGRLLARLVLCSGAPAPTVWDLSSARRTGAFPYPVLSPEADARKDYARISDVSGSSDVLDSIIGRLAPGGEIVLGGFYAEPLRFAFPPAFMREARLRVAAQWRPDDLAAVVRLVSAGSLSLDGLITDHASAGDAVRAYERAFGDEACLKMVLDWRGIS